ncbi:hypothetical protein BDU57DRAFT_522255 [Ampelomyces quisqualis]|uniref:Uncharacterized protein n=1 Tax=Ampelomyces quisqualis TaxID=50730 RepID=A0A6A5QH20_AMPQU|nr:hypothetical protein BDU57DRAFT_522255 [Ampelomyces quisqualis]
MNMTHFAQITGSLESLERFCQTNEGPVCDASNMPFFGTIKSLSENTREHFAYLFDDHYMIRSLSSIAGDPEQRINRVR